MLTERRDQAVGTEALSDADLIGRSLAHPACFATIFDRHAEEILRYAHARLGPDLAEDVVAETFLAAFCHRDRYDTARADARPWLYGIAVRQIGRHRRAGAQRNADGTVTVTLKDVFDLGGLQQALADDGVPAKVITVPTNPATYTGPLVAANPATHVTVSGCFYPATGGSFAPAPVQQSVVAQVVTAPDAPIKALYVIHPSAMPRGSVLLIQGVALRGQGPATMAGQAAADVVELGSFPAPAVLAGDLLPPSCTWRVVARLPFTLLPGGSARK